MNPLGTSLLSTNSGSRRNFMATGLTGLAAASVGANVAASGKIDGVRRAFAGKVVCITGATSGIGREAALQFARQGARVGFCGRREALGRSLESQIRGEGGEALFVPADVRLPSDVQRFVDGVVGAFGGLDIAINNAGTKVQAPVHELALGDWEKVFDTNVKGVFLSMRAQIPHLLRRGGGSILVTSSTQAFATRPKDGVYSASKSALLGLVRAAALDYGPSGIRVNAILPGTTDTELVRRQVDMENAPEAEFQRVATEWAKVHVPGLRRMASAAEVAALMLNLCSDQNSFMTGSTVVVDGGALSAQV